jgi:hypothetical protein
LVLKNRNKVGLFKTEAARDSLEKINPDVGFEVHTTNICTVANFEVFLDRLKHGGKSEGHKGGVDFFFLVFFSLFFQLIWFWVVLITLKRELQSTKRAWNLV